MGVTVWNEKRLDRFHGCSERMDMDVRKSPSARPKTPITRVKRSCSLADALGRK